MFRKLGNLERKIYSYINRSLVIKELVNCWKIERVCNNEKRIEFCN